MKLKHFLATTAMSFAVVTVGQAATIAPSAYFFNKKADVKTVQLDGGSSSTVKWTVSSPSQYQVFATIPANATAKNATYRIYPNGKGASDDSCTTAQKSKPCYEVMVDQSANQGSEVQLTVGTTNAWKFTSNGFVSVSASNVRTDETLGTGYVRFTQPTPPKPSFSKVANDGSALAVGSALGTGATDWACTKDNNTGLVWEAKPSADSSTGKTHTYSWYNPSNKKNGGFKGYANLGKCPEGLSCDTDNHVKAVNASKLCGYDDWRLPTLKELMNIVDPSFISFVTFSGALDSTYFPGAGVFDRYWTSETTDENVTQAKYVILLGSYGYTPKEIGGFFGARLVRGK